MHLGDLKIVLFEKSEDFDYMAHTGQSLFPPEVDKNQTSINFEIHQTPCDVDQSCLKLIGV